jgi:hypothetical protein
MLSWAVVYFASFPSDPTIAVSIYSYTRDSQKVMPHMFFISCCLPVGHMKISQNFMRTLLKGYKFSNLVSIFVNSLLPPLNRSMCFCPGEVAVPPPQPLVHSASSLA